MTDEQTITRKEFPNGDVAVDEGTAWSTARQTLPIPSNLTRPATAQREPFGPGATTRRNTGCRSSA
jgi:hypothetical protein